MGPDHHPSIWLPSRSSASVRAFVEEQWPAIENVALALGDAWLSRPAEATGLS